MDEHLLRRLAPEVTAVLVRRGADFAAAEDAVQEALVSAWSTWSAEPPRDPKAWLVTAAWRRFVDATRAESSRAAREVKLGLEPRRGPTEHADDTLELYFRAPTRRSAPPPQWP